MAVFTEDLCVRVGVVSIFAQPPENFSSAARRADTPGEFPPDARVRACQLRGNEVHDWITRGCTAIELRLLVRHGVGGRGCMEAAFTDGIQRYPPAPISFLSLSLSLSLCLCHSLSSPFIFLSVSFRARDAGPKRAAN